MIFAIAAAMAAAVQSPQVDVGRFDAGAYPVAPVNNQNLPYAAMVEAVEQILRQHRCEMDGQSYRRFDIRVPYLIQVGADGSISRVVITDLDCPAIEEFVGLLVVERARIGAYRRATGPQWYRSEIRFTLE